MCPKLCHKIFFKIYYLIKLRNKIILHTWNLKYKKMQKLKIMSMLIDKIKQFKYINKINVIKTYLDDLFGIFFLILLRFIFIILYFIDLVLNYIRVVFFITKVNTFCNSQHASSVSVIAWCCQRAILFLVVSTSCFHSIAFL